MYIEEQKYGGLNESLDFKLTIFYDIYNRIDVPPEAYLKAFPTMLKGMALEHFYNTKAAQIYDFNFEKVCIHVRNFFEGPGF